MSAMYDSGRETFLAATSDWDADSFKLVMVNSGYTFSAGHANLSDIVSGNRVATSPALTGKTTTGGVADAADVTLPAVDNGTITGYAVFKDTGTEATSTLICFVDKDVDGTTPISLATNGSDVAVQFDAAGIFKL